jgi:hypothetical protein
VTQTTAVLNGTINPNGSAAAAGFEYARNRGLVGATMTAPEVVPVGLGAVPVSTTLTALPPHTRYYVRVEATNTATGASVKGAILSFTTAAALDRIGSWMNWSFPLHRTYATVALLSVQRVPIGARVVVSCVGTGCPYASHTTVVTSPRPGCKDKHKRCKPKRPPATRNLNLAPQFGSRHLAIGSRMTVRILKTGWIGKIYIFPIRRSIQPTISCLAPGDSEPGHGC